ncbi:cytotoxic and regulatory T-cell molecule [Diretmus argenteus]
MELKLQLSLLMLLIEVWQHITVMEGRTFTLRCPMRKANMNHVEWKNPRGYVMFFNDNKALKDKRYSIDKLSKEEFTVSVSNVTFKDGGNYTCHQYSHGATEKKVEVTVLGYPKLSVTKHDGKVVVKCSAEANHHPPQIYWDLGQGVEITGWTLVSEVTEQNTSHNGTEGNNTRGSDDIDRRRGKEGSATLLVFLVSCLIAALLVVVIFFAIKLRRAHILWKRENEDSEQSEESSKSKSSHEERLFQGQRRRGILNTVFTKYVVEKTEIAAETNTTAASAADSITNAETPPAHITPNTDALVTTQPKETDL